MTEPTLSIDEMMLRFVGLPAPQIDPTKWRAALNAARSKRPVRCRPWTNRALRLIAVSNALHECRSNRIDVGAGLFRLLKGKTS